MRVPFLVLLGSVGVLGGANFQSINCPGAGSSCSYKNTKVVDEVISIFFQVELASGESQGSFTCSNGQVTYCHRKYASSDSGSAGDCFFLLPAGQQFDCTVQGTVNFIGSHAADMAAANMLSTVTDIPCSGASCSYTNTQGSDMWVAHSFEAQATGTNSMSCSYNSIEVCAYSVGNSVGGYSCNYILPAGATVTCKATQGSFNMLTSAGVSFKGTYLPSAAQVESQWNCPNVTYPLPNLCDCSYTNTHTSDLVVTVTATSVDENFNAFHCYFGGANVCAWGSNTNDKGNKGGCYFILPPGQQLQCQMQWGAASFSVSTALVTNGTLFKGNTLTEAKRAAPLEEPVDCTMTLEEHKQVFAAWKKAHGKQYATQGEEAKRFANFRKHMSAFHKKSDVRATLPNSLADWSKGEFEAHLRDCARSHEGITMPPPPAEYVITAQDINDIPESVDWRTKGVVTPVKDQGQCGSCWSFSASGAMESAWAIAGNALTSLSEQQLVSCDTADGNAGCNGGWPYKAIDYVRDNGDATEASYPYVSGNGNAPACSGGHTMADIKVTGYFAVNQTEDAMAAAVAKYGPVSIALDAMTQLWWPYTGGIMTGCCNHDPDHAVLIVGYGVDSSGTKYWIIKNSWGASWGENGYVRLERGTNQCGITSAPVMAVVQGSGPTPPGPTPPTPPPTPTPAGSCPAECVKSSSNGVTTCTWRNNTNGVIIPPPSTVIPDCSYYPTYNSFSYVWNGTVANPSSYPCPPSAVHQEGKDSEEFCVFYNGMNGLNIPSGATLNCSSLVTSGTFSYSYSS